MNKIFFCLIICLFLSGCCTIINENEQGRHVRGIGADVTFYPVFSVRIGVYEYQIFFIKDKKEDI